MKQALLGRRIAGLQSERLKVSAICHVQSHDHDLGFTKQDAAEHPLKGGKFSKTCSKK